MSTGNAGRAEPDIAGGESGLGNGDQEQWRAWIERDRFDPDCWFRIPDFGVLPSEEDDFRGFEWPIVYPSNPRLNAPMRGFVRTARALVKRDGLASMREVYEAADQAFAIMTEHDLASEKPWPELLEPKQYAAFLYTWIVSGLERFDASQYGTPEDSIANLAFSAEWLASWALDGAESILRRVSETNSQNASGARVQVTPGDVARFALERGYGRQDGPKWQELVEAAAAHFHGSESTIARRLTAAQDAGLIARKKKGSDKA